MTKIKGFGFGISREDMAYILATAFEAGSYGSIRIVEYGPKVDREIEDAGGSMEWTRPRYMSDPLNGGSISVADAYGDGETGKITATSLRKGLTILRDKHKRLFAQLVSGEYDVIAPDALLQAAAFGEVIYG